MCFSKPIRQIVMVNLSVAIAKNMIELNSTVNDAGLNDLVSACTNCQTTVHGGGLAYQRLLRHQPFSELPNLPRTLSKEERDSMSPKMSDHWVRYRTSIKKPT